MTGNVLITGAVGFIGQHLVYALRQVGTDVIAQEHRTHAEFGTDVQIVPADVDYAELLPNCDTVFWLASATTPASSVSHPEFELTANLTPLLGLLQVLQTQPNCQLIYVSSGGTLYGDVKQPAAETLAAHPCSYYAAGKAAAEHFVEAYCRQHNGSAIILRPSNIYGPGQTLHGGFGVIPAAMGCLLHSVPMTIWGDGESLRDYLYIDDFMSACVAVMQAPVTFGLETYNVCSGMGTSLNQLLRQIEYIAGCSLQRNYHLSRSMDLRHVLLDNTRIRQRLDWSPQTSLHDGLQQTWQWLASTSHEP